MATLLGQWKALNTAVVAATAAAFAVVLVFGGTEVPPSTGHELLSSVFFCLLSTVLLTTVYFPQLLKRSSNALRDVVCRAEPVSRSTVARALKSGQGVKASFGVTRAVIGCMHS